METVLRKRPVGIILLALFHWITGFGILVSSILIWVFFDKLTILFALVATPPERFITGGLIACVMLILTGVMMWRGDKWGYYLTSFHYIVGMLQNLCTIAAVPLFLLAVYPNVEPHMILLPQIFYPFYGIQALFQLLIFGYFYLPKVREYFGLKDEPLKTIAMIQFGACAAMAVLSLAVVAFR